METKKVLMNWRGAPIGARTPDGCGIANAYTRSGRIANPTGRVGRALRCCLTAVLMLFAAQGAWADDYTGYVYSANQTYDSFKNAHPDEPWIWLEKTTYNMQNDVNVYEFRLKYSAQGTSVQDYDYLDWNNSKQYWTKAAAFGWFGDVWLTIDGARIFNLSTLAVGVSGFTGYIGSPNFLCDPPTTHVVTVTYGFNGSFASTKYSTEEFLSGKSSGIGNTTDVYVSLCKAKTGTYNNWICGSWYPNMSDHHVNHDNYVTVRVAIERAWSHKNYTIGIEGTWGGLKAQNYYYDRSSTPTYTRTYKITTSTDAFTAPSVPWPSNGGTLTRNGSKKVTYKAPSGLSSKTGKQNKTSDWTVDQTESCTFLNNVYLMKSAGNESLPWTSIKSASNYYDKLVNVSSSQTVDITEGVSNYEPFYVYPCWELKSENVYIALPSLSSSNQYNQSHNKFMDALVVPGYPCPTNVDVKTVDAFSRQVNVSWGWQVYDANHCDKNGTWRVYRLDSNGQRIKLGEVSNGSAATYSLNYTASSPNDKPAYGKDYTYTVCFVPNGWNNVTSEDDVPGLSASKIAKIEPKFTVTLNTPTVSTSKISLSWTHNAITDASGSNKYVLEIYRSSDEKKTWTKVHSIDISDPEKNDGSWDDTSIESSQDYYYKLRFPSVQGQAWESNTVFKTSSGSSFVANSFKASCGDYASAVKLTWQVNQAGTNECYFTLQRRPLGTVGDEGWANIYTTHGTATTYSYDDQTAQPGSFNEYKLILSEKVNGVVKARENITTDGFCMATGTMSGRVAFGSGTAVDSVKVTMRPSSTDGNTLNRFRSLYFANSGAGMNCVVDSVYLRKMMQGDFTFQMWVNPDNSKMTANGGDYLLVDVKNAFSIYLRYDSNLKIYHVGTYVNGGTRYSSENAYIPANAWSHITVTHSGNMTKVYVNKLENGKNIFKEYVTSNNNAINWSNSEKVNNIAIANSGTFNFAKHYEGYVDEFRVFNRVLTMAEIGRNYNHPLVGDEDGLQIYYSFDEGLKNQKLAYDFSKQNGVSNGHHATAKVAATSSTIVPSEEQFSLMGYTDKEGNYMIGGIPFSGNGTNYVATPTLGIHQFSPANQSRFFTMNSLVQSGVDFEDVSSFPVSGTVYYSHTTIPVKDVYIKVDGITASKDGKPVQTNAKGEFTVDVPIGEHFVSLSMTGHTFENGGRYPEDPYDGGKRANFNQAVSGLTFYDNTTVTVAGRVAGGDIENNKPLGLGLGKANIGQATFTLEQENSTGYLSAVRNSSGNYNICATDSAITTASGTAMIPASKNYITVTTDATTGEWVAQLPPLRYKMSNVTISSNDAIVFNNDNLPVIDATNPSMVYTDSIVTESGEMKKFEYVGSAKLEYKAPSILEVTENADGSFGMKEYTVKDVNGNEHKVDVYAVGEDGKVTYAFGVEGEGADQTPVYYGVEDTNHSGYPVYEEMATYTYNIYACERYVNKDGAEEVIDEVPLIGNKVTIKNPFASTSKVICQAPDGSGHKVGEVYEMENNTFELDSLGCGTYQFTVGYPNVQAPYTRGLTITYDVDGTEKSWSGNSTFKAFILGGLPTGNNFVTQGPDEILMVLRDAPGTGSSTTWSKGSTLTITKGRTVEPHGSADIHTSIYAGGDMVMGEGIGFMVIQDMESTCTVNVGAEASFSFSNMKSTTTTITSTKDVSTSDGFDFNGAGGDLFIGSAKNLLFGACHSVDIQWDNVNGKPQLYMDEALATGEEFTTGFAYTQNYVKNVLIPNFEWLRDSTMTRVDNVKNVARPARGGDPIYVTTLKPGDYGFGSSNNDVTVWDTSAVPFSALKDGRYEGPSYTMILPEDWEKDMPGVQDMINFYNLQIKKWEHQLYLNEEAKVTAIKDRNTWLRQNHSFDAGASITESITNSTTKTRVNTETEEVNAAIGLETGFSMCGLGFGVDVTYSAGMTISEEQGREETEEETFSYTLAEDGDDDYMSVDVFEAPDGFGPIFYTRAGATSCPYQDEEKTEYYMDGGKPVVIMEKTVQIEKPEIEAATQALTGIPAGGKGTFQMYIRNNSDTKEDGWYDIMVVSKSNPDGLVVKMDGLNITQGRSVLVEAGTTMTKTFTVEQSNPDVLTYKDIVIRIASQCQKDNTGVYPEIADSTTISVYFQPSCSDVQLASSHSLVNSDTQTKQTLSISGYNHSMQSLKGIRLQYKGEHDANFTTLQEYSKDEERVAADPNVELLPALEGTNKLNYVIDLRDDVFADKTYVFRAVTVCDQGGVEVNNESDEVTIIRDMTRPQLMATPSPASGILSSGDDLLITFNEDIQGNLLTKPNNFEVMGVLNESELLHDVALSLTGENAAKTEGTMDLADKSFSASMWVNYSENGTLLQHGTKDRSFTVAVEDGKLAVNVAGTKVTSSASLPANKWVYLNVAYDADMKQVSAGYASDASEVMLLSQETVPAYEGNGPVSVGGNDFVGKVHELALWNGFHSMAEAQAEMYTTKSQFTNGLMGYWPLDEGHGDVATDKARSRNLTLPSVNAWWINGDNYALPLDGTKAAAVNIGALNTTASEDYLVEAWFKADESNNAVASVLSTLAMDLRLNAQGKLEMALPTANAEGTVAAVYDKDLRDGQWHHVAVNVLKSTNGSGIVYVDGQQRKQLSASVMPALYGDKLLLGAHQTGMLYDQLLKGAVDEVRIWKGRRTADVIKNNMYARVKGDETGLVAYYPLETSVRDQYNQIVSTATLVNKKAETKDTLAFYAANGTNVQSSMFNLQSENTAALKQAPQMDQVSFSFVTSERQIKVNLEELPAKMEGCTIYITAKDVKDVNGNSALPITWSVYVQQNNLKWTENDLAVTKEGAEEATFTATIENRGSQSETWSLSGLPMWLSAKNVTGSLMPLTSQKLTFTVAGSLPIGTYETTVYLTGSQNIATPLNITVTSEGDAPDWTVIPGESTMNVIGVLMIDGVQSSDPKDMVAAFRGTECVGVAQPKYFSRNDSYMVMMNIYGNAEAPLTYKAYDASTGTVYPSVSVDNESAYTYVNDKAVGTFTAPVTFAPLNEIEQDLSMDHAAWKWFSLYAQPKMNDVSVVFKDALDAITAVTNGTETLSYWVGDLESFDYSRMYKLNATAPYKELLVGKPTNPDSIDIKLNGNGWTWLGYPCQAMNSLDAAFASVAQEGDMVKNQTSFSVYTKGAWMGTLTAMVPGEGYMYQSTAATAKTFNFPKPTVSGASLSRAARVSRAAGLTSAASYKDNMTMIAVVMNGDEVVTDAQVSVYANGELRAFSGEAIRVNPCESEATEAHFLTIGGEGADVLTFVVSLGEEPLNGHGMDTDVTRKEYMLSQTDVFAANAQRGTLAKPVVLQLAEATGIDMAVNGVDIKSIQLFDASGRLVANGSKLYTKADLKQLPAGVYYQQVTYQNGQTRVQKLMR